MQFFITSQIILRFLYDIIFMDINLPDMLGSEATKIMREYENEYSSKKTTIIAVSVEGKKNVKMDYLFNDYCKSYLMIF